MSLVWHIIRKDFRRLRWPLLVWLLLPVASWTLLVTASRSVLAPEAFASMTGYAGTWIALTWVIGLILAAWLVMEDGLVSTRAFWRTRPVRGARLLSAKVLGAVLMFGVLPVLVMTPIWLSNGFSLRELGLAAVEMAAKHTIFTVVAFAIASVTETPGQFLVRLVGVVVLGSLTFAYCAGIIGGGWEVDANGWVETRYRVVMGVFLLMPLIVVVHQYLTRRLVRSYGLLGMGLGLVLLLRLVWQWDLTSLYRKLPTDDAPTEIRFTQHPASLELRHKQAPFLNTSGTMSGAPAGSYVSFDTVRSWWGEVANRHYGGKFHREASPPLEQAARQVIGLSGSADSPVEWNACGFADEESLARAHTDKLQLAIRANLMRGQVVGELPLRIGAVLRAGASSTRVISIDRIDGRLVVWLEERLAWPPWSARTQDSFLLRNHAVAPEAEYVPVTAERSFPFASISLGQRQLSIAIPMREVDGRIREVPDWEESARLVKVRFTPGQWFNKILTVDLPAQPTP